MTPAPRSFHRGIALLVAAAFFMENLDGTIIQTAAPAMAGDFGVAPTDLNVAMVSYLLAVAVGVPASGWLADRFGVRRVFLTAVALFTVASLACAVAPTLGVLVAARVVQGIGGAMMIPVGRLAVLRTTSTTDLLEAIAYLTWPALLAPVIAPLLGGILTETVGWPWIFFLNLPLGIAAFIAGLVLLPRHVDLARRPFDRAGFGGVAAALVLVTVGAELLSAAGAAGVIAGIAVIAAGAGVGVVFVARMRRSPHPLLDWAALGIHTFRVGNVSGGVYRLMISGAPFLFTLLFQVSFGWSAVAAGLAVMAIFAGNVGIKPATTAIIRRWGFRRVLIWSNAIGMLILAAFAVVDAQTPVWVIVALLLASGVFRSIGFSAYNTLQFVDIDPARLTGANTLASTLQQVATALGLAVVAMAVRGGTAVSELIVHGPGAGYSIAFVLAALLMVVPLVGALSLAHDAGAAATRRAA